MNTARATHMDARLVGRERIAEGLAVFRFELEEEFSFAPGQFAVLGMPDSDGKRVERAYSIASAPRERPFEFFIELNPQGRLTPLLHHKLQVGEVVSVRPRAGGRFLLDPGAENHLMVATVTGVAPFRSMIREHLRTGGGGRFFLIHGASHVAELGFREEFEMLASERDWFRFVSTVSRPEENRGWKGEIGRANEVLPAWLSRWALTPENTTAYLCGHPGMVRSARAVLEGRGFHPERVRQESW